MAYLEDSYLLGVHWVNCDTYTLRIAHLQSQILLTENKFQVPIQQLHTVKISKREVLEYCANKAELRELERQLATGGGTKSISLARRTYLLEQSEWSF